MDVLQNISKHMCELEIRQKQIKPYICNISVQYFVENLEFGTVFYTFPGSGLILWCFGLLLSYCVIMSMLKLHVHDTMHGFKLFGFIAKYPNLNGVEVIPEY